MNASRSGDSLFLTSFRHKPSGFPGRDCALRFQIGDAGHAEEFERYLEVLDSSEARWDRGLVDGMFHFRVEGGFEALDRAFGLRSGNEASPDSNSASEAFRRWSERQYSLSLPRGRRWQLGLRPAILGILNITPDSFSDGGCFLDPDAALRRALQMLEEGADAIDIGGESTRPGSRPVSAKEEISRVVEVLGEIRKKTDAPISIDTSKAEVARIALEEGADIVNDVTALEGDAAMIPLLAERRDVPVVLMHMRGRPETMQVDPSYDDAVAEILRYLNARIQALRERGVGPERTIVDPGFGFGKPSLGNLELLRDAGEFRSLGRPVLIGLSRKSFLGSLLGKPAPESRETATTVAHTVVGLAGTSILRTHDIPAAREVALLLKALEDGS